jgi:hypothetical protein
MFKKIAEFFTGKKPEAAPEAPYKVDPIPAGTEASVIAVSAPAVEAVVVVVDAVVPAAVVEQAPAVPKKPRAPAKPKAVKEVVAKAPAAPKKPRAPKAK